MINDSNRCILKDNKYIANKLGATKQNVTQLIKSLEKKGLVAIAPSKKDRRRA
ncbi:MarR family winged helix-turn-helix transcriptional regulator [Lacrimispora sphenoides]|uniref:MarR family winged helix-turn-helix transcriptional regulator n=1 Tax=Lacrimispora sphenoides TaxID=29370 RepID=UPI00241D390F